jgi:glycosyltransferase involved in cell wall biosynthesis
MKINLSKKPEKPLLRNQSVGLIFDLLPSIEKIDLVFGARIATDSFLHALLRHGHYDRYDLLAYPGQEEAVKSWLRNGKKRLQIHDYQTLMNGQALPEPSVWHEAGGYWQRLYHLRQFYSARPVPITFVQYTISYQFLLHKWYLPLLLSQAKPYDSVICISESAKRAHEYLLNHVKDRFNEEYGTRLNYKGRHDVIPLGVDTNYFQQLDKKKMRDRYEVDPDAFVLLWVGRLSVGDKADLKPLMRVFARLVQRNRDRKLLFMMVGGGDPNYIGALKEYGQALGIGDKMTILNNVPANEQLFLYNLSDVFVSPVDNVQESFGLTPIEAMACGIPQVVADWDGYRETVVHGKTGYLIKTLWLKSDSDLERAAGLFLSWEYDHLALAQSVVIDLDDYCDRLQVLIDRPDLRAEMAAASRQRAVAEFDWSRVIGRYEALWTELSDCARRDTGEPEQASGYQSMPFFEAFRHYATETLSEEALLVLTDSGSAILKAQEPLPYFPYHAGPVSLEVIKRALHEIQQAQRDRNPVTFGAQVNSLTRRHRCGPDYIRRNLLWLVKHGVVKVIEG